MEDIILQKDDLTEVWPFILILHLIYPFDEDFVILWLRKYPFYYLDYNLNEFRSFDWGFDANK
jgi:hypothetical protein